MKPISRFVIALTLLLAPLSAAAQSCALCYTQASSAGARMIDALRSGILVLIIPPTLMTVGMFFVVHRKTYQFRNSSQPADTQSDLPDSAKTDDSIKSQFGIYENL